LLEIEKKVKEGYSITSFILKAVSSIIEQKDMDCCIIMTNKMKYYMKAILRKIT